MLRVLGKRLLVKKEEVKKSGGLLLPEDSSPQEIFIVVSPGTEVPLKAGEKILAHRAYKQKVDLEGEEFFIMSLEDVLGVLDG